MACRPERLKIGWTCQVVHGRWCLGVERVIVLLVLEGHEASANVTGLIRTVEKYGLVFGELQKLCQKLGVHCNFDSDVDKTFKKYLPFSHGGRVI